MFEFALDFNEFWSYFAQKSIFEESLKTNYEENTRPIFAPKMSKEAY